jgi:hypothetical protein
MNARVLFAAVALIITFTLPPLTAAEEKSATEKVKETTSDVVDATKKTTKKAAHVIAETTRQAWKKTKAYFSEDTKTYREGATKQLKELESEIAQLEAKSAGDRDYFTTRVRALEQQHKYAENQLAGLASEDLKRGKESKRNRLDQVIERLEDNVDLAQKEAKDFAPAE